VEKLGPDHRRSDGGNMSSPSIEAWLRGPVPGVPALLNPAAHALQHAAEDADRALAGLSAEAIWQRPGGVASVGYHVRHLSGALDRLFTYARGEALTDEQRDTLAREEESGEQPQDGAAIGAELHAAIERALDQLRRTPDDTLLEPRPVGRQRLPSTVVGLLFHAAEHASRHAGQALTTAKIVRLRIEDGTGRS
jgi:uncharacterized damage-inducible protein DinB